MDSSPDRSSSPPSARTLSLRPVFPAAAILGLMACRLMPHPPNFTPLVACAPFGGATFVDRRAAFLLPLAALALSDLYLGFGALTPVIYACFLIETAMGLRLRPRRRAVPIAVAAFVGACLFFLITNGACWLAYYPRTAAGSAGCYASAIPFFANTLAGAAFASLLFGAPAAAEGVFPSLREGAIPAVA